MKNKHGYQCFWGLLPLILSVLLSVLALGPTTTDTTWAAADPASVSTPSQPEKHRLPKGKNRLLSVRAWSSPDSTRVVIETSGPVAFKHFRLNGQGDVVKRLVIDLDHCRIPARHQPTVPVGDGLLKQVRSAQFSENTVRVVLDTQSMAEYKIFSLAEPFRVVVDVLGGKSREPARAKATTPPAGAVDSGSGRPVGPGLGRIVLDPGHGGKDCGAISPNGLKEKDITLKVARRVAKILEKEPGYQVILTRSEDVFIPLEERTAIANSKSGDLFISIHVNSAPTSEAQGIETYFLNLTNNQDAMRVAARENSSSASQMSDLQIILRDLIQSTNIHESAALAELVQDSMVSGLGKKFENTVNLGVKRAPFVVLIGARMPAVLAEIAFLSNPREEMRLMDESYLDTVAEQIAASAAQYATSLNLAAK